MNYSVHKSVRSSINYSPSRQKLLQISVADERYDIANLAMSEIYWDEILSVEKLEGEFEVYDISVPDHHNFVANDIIVHNSYTMGVIAEGMLDLEPEVKNNLSIIMLDTMGVYWTMKYPNHKDEELLREWGLEGKGLDVTIYTPKGYFKRYKEDGIPTDFAFSLKPSDLDVDDWLLTFDLEENDPIGVLVQRTLNTMRKEKPDFSIEDFIAFVEKDEEVNKEHRMALISRLKGTEDWGLFDENGTAIKDLALPGNVVILDVSCYATMPGGWKVKSLVIGIVAKKLFIDRMISRKFEEFRSISSSEHYFESEKPKEKEEMPLVWLVIDEAHEFLPVKGKTSATDALVTIMREGRQPGISLILATQQPGKIHTDVMTQSDIVLSHRITAKLDVDALGMLMQSYMRDGLTQQLDNLPRVKGAGILFDDSNERMYPIRMRPRFTWHGGEAPSAVHKEKEKLDF